MQDDLGLFLDNFFWYRVQGAKIKKWNRRNTLEFQRKCFQSVFDKKALK